MTRLKFILTTTVIITTALALVYTAEVMEAQHRELLAEAEADRDQLECMEWEKAELEERNSELTKTLHNRTSTLSRGGRPGGWETMPVIQPSGLGSPFFEAAFAGTGLEGIGKALVAAEEATGINALVLAGIVVLETGWGSSRLSRERNNLGGLGAYDGREDECGFSFCSRDESIMFLAQLLAVDYAPGGCYFGGSHDLAGIGVRYASDPAWAAKVAGCMAKIAGEASWMGVPQ